MIKTIIGSIKKNPYIWLWSILFCYIIYGTLIPFIFCSSLEDVLKNIRDANYIPFYHEAKGKHISISDIVSNIVLFIPYGFLLRLGLEPYYVTRCGLKCVGSAFLLSLFIELYQLFVYSRVSSTTDIINDTLGAWIGYILAINYIHYLKNKIDKTIYNITRAEPFLFYLIVYSLFITLIFMFPFDISIDEEDLRHGIRDICFLPFYFKGMLHLSWMNIGINAMAFAIFGFIGYAALRHYYSSNLFGAFSTLIFGFFLACAIELFQILIVSRVTDMSNIISRMAGIFPGMIISE